MFILGMGNMMDQMKKAQEIAKQAQTVNKELMETIVMGQDPSGRVISTFNALGVPISMKVADSIASTDGEALSLACSQAMVDGHRKVIQFIFILYFVLNILSVKAQETMMKRMQALYADAGIPLPPAPQ